MIWVTKVNTRRREINTLEAWPCIVNCTTKITNDKEITDQILSLIVTVALMVIKEPNWLYCLKCSRISIYCVKVSIAPKMVDITLVARKALWMNIVL